ncbi:MAG TPA: helix-turn-helix domain-containing protein [Terriglobales bacterium]|nr:helix-turn-helix domain-containing protein [Terriglobales bacterium]
MIASALSQSPLADVVSVQWTARRLGVSEVTVLRYIEEGRIGAYQVCKRGWWKVSKRSVLAFEQNLLAQMNGEEPGAG